MATAEAKTPTFRSFNPTHDERVDKIKAQADALIGLLDELGENAEGEAKRRFALAKTNIEQGAMWGVKALFS
jgi:uncharacterized protein YukE